MQLIIKRAHGIRVDGSSPAEILIPAIAKYQIDILGPPPAEIISRR
jgi:hypothetical protein